MIKKEKSFILFAIMFIMLFIGVGGVLAVSGVDIGITGTIGDYASEVTLITDSNAGVGIDAYDMPAPSAPDSDSYSNFYSTVGSTGLAIDTWDENPRSDILLVYDMPNEESGSLVFSWDDISGVDYTASMTISGSVVVANMVSDSDNQYVYSGADGSDVSIYITIANIPSAAVESSAASSGGGGGGAVVTLPSISIIQDAVTGKLLFDTAIIIPLEQKNILEGDSLMVSIDLDPQIISGNPDLDVWVRYYIIDLDTGNEVNLGEAESESIRITGQKTFTKTFFTQNLPSYDDGAGKEYELWLELRYCTMWVDGECKTEYAYAEASSEFLVASREEAEQGKGLLAALSGYRFIFLALGFGMIVLIILTIIVLAKTRKPKKRR